MKNYNLYLSKFIKKKYKNSTIFELSLLSKFFNHRKYYKTYLSKNLFSNKIKKNDSTFEFIFKIFNNRYSKSLDKKLLIFYKKFEINLSLKKNYNSNFLKKTNTETSSSTYVYLGLSIINSNFLDKFQKVNCIIKIVDKILSKKEYVKSCNSNRLLELINLEKKLLSKNE